MTNMSKSAYIASLTTLIPDNSSQQVSPQDIRTSLTNLADSVNSFLVDLNISGANFSTSETRTTRAGELAMNQLNYAGRSSYDNSAFGYYALGANYSGINNTAIGSHSLGCNLYGSQNVGVGFNSLAGNLTGSGNIGIGNHTLQLNKHGSFNIAIGNGAGYYIGESDSNQFYLASTAQDTASLVDAVSGSGENPLLHGDLSSSNLRLGIAVKALHNYGSLQVSGAASPSQDKKFDLGNQRYNWRSAYISSGVGYSNSGNFTISVHTHDGGDIYSQDVVAVFTSGGHIGIGTETPSGAHGILTVAGNIVPSEDIIYKLGAPNLRWDGYFNDIVVSGNASINDLQYNTINECLYDCKTLHLATSGLCDGSGLVDASVCGYLSDEGIDGAGFQVHSSGADYRRDYGFVFRFPDQSLTALETDSNYARARWQSNISIEIDDGRHLQTDRVLGDGKLSFVTQSGNYGFFIRTDSSGNKAYLGDERHITAGYTHSKNINIIGPSGSTSDFIVSIGSPGSGLLVGQQFATRISGGMVGFGIEYHDDRSNRDRLSTHVYNRENRYLEAVSILRNVHPSSGLFGITNISYTASSVLPETIFNVQASSVASIRLSTLSTTEKAKLELLGNGNAKASGAQISYQASTDNFDFSVIRPSGSSGIESGVMTINTSGFLGVGYTHNGSTRNWHPNSPLTINSSTVNSGTIALKEQASAPSSTSDFGKIYVKPRVAGSLTQALYFTDDVGNESILSASQLSTTDGLLYGDASGNTYGGWYSPQSRPAGSSYNNTTLGFGALYSAIANGDNIAIGKQALSGCTTGYSNIVIGNATFQYKALPVGNIIIGHYVASGTDASVYPTGSIVIGSGLSHIPNQTLMIGNGADYIVSGYIGSSNRTLSIKDAKLSVDSQYRDHQLSISNVYTGGRYRTYLDVQDHLQSNTTSGYLALRFLDVNSNARVLMNFDHSASGMAETATYAAPVSGRPFAELNGDLKLKGAIRFRDGTSVETASDITITQGTGVLLDSGVLSVYYDDLPNSLNYESLITLNNSYLALAVPSGSETVLTKVDLSSMAGYVGSGFASVGHNCNHIFTSNDAGVNKLQNSGTVFIGCDAGVSATGWKNSIMIGTQAGHSATTPNTNLATDTACTFIGFKAGRDADNIENSVFIGTQAGYLANAASDSVFIGSSAGENSQFTDSVGIGQHALRGTASVESGSGNIELVAGLDDNERLLYSQAVSRKLNINNAIAGDTSTRRISIGDAVLSPDAPLSVRKDDTIAGHSSTPYLQSWYHNDTRVAGIDVSGNHTAGNGMPITVEGFAAAEIAAPALASSPTSGIVYRRDEGWNTADSFYVVNRDVTLTIHAGAYVIAQKINGTYRPIWVSCPGA